MISIVGASSIFVRLRINYAYDEDIYAIYTCLR